MAGRPSKAPRVVIVTRPTEYEMLLGRHSTRGQTDFFLKSRGLSVDAVEARHDAFNACLKKAIDQVPVSWRRNQIVRDDLSRFLFEPDDTVVVVGQDGLVANVAKYLTGQPVIGINPDASQFEGVLVPHPVERLGALLPPAVERRARTQDRIMVGVELDDGQRLTALNEIYLGCRTHQSSRYSLSVDGRSERHSSSGMIVATGTGATGWARSVFRERRTEVHLPTPEEARLTFFVREAWPSVATGTDITDGELGPGSSLVVVSEMNEDGVVFGDGIEKDCLVLEWGKRARIGIAEQRLRLVMAG